MTLGAERMWAPYRRDSVGGRGRRLTLVGTILLGLAKLPDVFLPKRRILELNDSVGVRGRSVYSLDVPNLSGRKKIHPYKSAIKLVIFFWAFDACF